MPIRFDSSASIGGANVVTGEFDNSITYGSLYENIKGVWPAVDATNGPLTADTGNVVGSLSGGATSGMTFYRWDSGIFNTQSQNWITFDAQSCMNATTPRGATWYGASAAPSHFSTGFEANTSKVILVYQTWGAVSFGSYHETHMWATEANGRLSQLRALPAVWPVGAATDTYFSRTVTFKEARRRRFKMWLSAGCFLAGVWVDSTARVSKTPNRPVLMGSFGDSWREPTGNVFAGLGGNGSVAGVTWPNSCSQLLSNMSLQFELNTDFAVALVAQGGTGYFNGGGTFPDPNLTADGTTPFLSASQVNHFWNRWGTKYPTVWCAGGWNDGGGNAPYQAMYKQRVLEAIARVRAKDANVPIIMTGCQPKLISVGDARDLGNRGHAEACAQAGVPFFDQLLTHWNGNLPSSYYGPDGLHPTVLGGDDQGMYDAYQIAALKTTSNRVMLTKQAT